RRAGEREQRAAADTAEAAETKERRRDPQNRYVTRQSRRAQRADRQKHHSDTDYRRAKAINVDVTDRAIRSTDTFATGHRQRKSDQTEHTTFGVLVRINTNERKRDCNVDDEVEPFERIGRQRRSR